MKRLLFSILILVGLLTACQPAAVTPTVTIPPKALPTSTGGLPVDLSPAQIVAIGTLSDALHLPLNQIKIVSTQAVDWPDSCLGIVHANQGCAQVVTPGLRLILEANQLQYEFHTDQAGRQIVGATLALIWHRSGGIAGFCDDLQVYLSGEVYGSSCKTGTAYPVIKLSADEMTQLATWVKAFGLVSLNAKDPAVADAMSTQLTLNGQGTTQPTDADKTALANFAQAASDKTKP
jgi:hypothetical protein